MKPDTAKRVTATGFRVIQSLELAPGRYNLRVAVREANTRKAGSVTFDLEVPDFSKQPLTMSDIAVTSAMSGAAPTVRPKDPLEKLLPGPLTSYREFMPIDEIALFTEIYDNIKQPHKVEITATVKAEGGQTVFQTREDHDSSELAGLRGRLRLRGAHPAEGFCAGAVRAARRGASRRSAIAATVAKEIVFRVARRRRERHESHVARLILVTGHAGRPCRRRLQSSREMMSMVDEPKQAVARTPAEWAALWRQHAGDTALPQVDFGSRTVVAVFLGTRPSAGYRGRDHRHCAEAGGALIVEWQRAAPGERAGVGAGAHQSRA